MDGTMVTVVEIACKTWMTRVMRMVRMMRIMRIIRISRIIRIRPVASEVKAWITPIIRSVVVIWIPVRIPTIVIIWPAEAKTCSDFNGDARFGRFLNDINGVDNAIYAVDDGVFFIIITLFVINCAGVEITVI